MLLLAMLLACQALPSYADGTPTLVGSKLLGVAVKHEFTVSLKGNKALKKQVKAMLSEQRGSNGKYQQASSARTASKYDQQLLYSYLRSQGYYAAKVDSKINNKKITHTITAGPQFTLASIGYDWPDNVPLPPATVLGVAVGDPLNADKVLQGVDAVRQWVQNNHCLREIEVSYEAVVNHPTYSAELTLQLKPSPQVNFGEVTFGGQQTIKTEYLKHFLGFRAGECFKPALLDSTRLKLLQTNLLANVEPIPAEVDDGTVPVHFRLTERKQRSIGGGLGYHADVKSKVSLSWQHRNLRGSGEQLNVDAIYSKTSQSIESIMVVPFFLHDKQRLTLNGRIANETPDAYELETGEAGATVQRKLWKGLTANVGVNLAFSRVKELASQDDFALLSFPVSLDYSTRNDPLNPTHGWVTGIQVEPFTDLYQTGRKFTRNTWAGSVYFTADDWRLRPTLAMRVATGTIDGSSLEAVPADQRFYSGGGGSVRGYRYQSLGAQVAGVPAGGLSFSETSLEVRTRITPTLGLTFFVDGGYAYPTKSPSFGQDFLWGAGLGLRYHTAFAPFRFDIATPLDARDGDPKVQVYVSIGQSF